LVLSWCGFGEDETISRNNETISNPAITAPINIGDPISANYSLLFLSTLLPSRIRLHIGLLTDVPAMRNE
jgi:hypothetical protein